MYSVFEKFQLGALWLAVVALLALIALVLLGACWMGLYLLLNGAFPVLASSTVLSIFGLAMVLGVLAIPGLTVISES